MLLFILDPSQNCIGWDSILLEASLSDRPLSMSLSALHFSFGVFTERFPLSILKSTAP